MDLIREFDRDRILADEVFIEVFEQEDEIVKARLLIDLSDRARELGVKAKFDVMLGAFKKVNKDMERDNRDKRNKQVTMLENWTNFTGGKYENMYCGAWVASDDGIYAPNFNSPNDILACYHPILPIERLKNLETGDEQIKLAYKRNYAWKEIIVPKDLIASASKIVSLSKQGVSVTSENAKYLVKYLSDVENCNEENIPVQSSTSKLGWIGEGFIPYDTDILFDGDMRYKQVFESICPRGSKEKWLDQMKELRATERMEVKFLLAASFSSVLVHLLGGLPFIVDLWGETEGGKTVSLMVAASVWANPDESRYIGDFKTTDVALEVKADMLNSLPMIIDDTSKVSTRIRDNFEGVVYDLCSGKGKSRSNRDLGTNRENRWKNCILTNGERPLNSYVSQGGAINRILEVECGEKVYSDPQKTADVIKKNYGFGGKLFVDILKELGIDQVRGIQTEFQILLASDEKMQKQSISLSIVLTADKIATDYIFHDKAYISIDEARKVLIDRNELSDNERCYRYLQDKIAMNAQRFDVDTKCEKWGVIENGFAIIYNSAFESLCKEAGYSKKSFLSWADKKGLLQTQKGNLTKLKKISGNTSRCVFLQLDDTADKDGFTGVEEYLQEELPFDSR